MWCFTAAAKTKAEPKKASTNKRAKTKAQARKEISGDEAARSAARPAVSRVTRSQKNLDAGSDTATTHAPKRGRRAASKPAAEASLEAVDPAVEDAAGAATELSDAAPTRAGKSASKHQVEQAPAAVADQADSTAADPPIGKVQRDRRHTLAAAPAASTQRTGGKLSRKAAENASEDAEQADLGDEASGAAAQAAPRKRGCKKASAAASGTYDVAKAGVAEGHVKHKKKRGRPAKQTDESGRHVRQKRAPIAADVASKSVYDYDN